MFKKKTIILILGDILILVFALWLALFLRYLSLPSRDVFYTHFYPFILIFTIWLLALYIAGFYSRQIIVKKIDFLPRLFKTQFISSMIAASIFYLSPFFRITPKTNLFLILLISPILLWFWRRIVYLFFNIKGENILLLADGKEADKLAGELLRHPFYGFSVMAIISAQEFKEKFVLGQEQFQDYLQKLGISLVVADFSLLKAETDSSIFYEALFSEVSFTDFRDFYEDIFAKIPSSILRKDWFLENVTMRRHGSYELWKRIFDIIFAIIFSLPALILFPFIALAIKIESPGPIFFRQKRVGRGEKVFELLKYRSSFRTSIDETIGWNKEPQSVYTKFGQFMRRAYLDEIPQVINVLRGDISFVGPRPERPEFVQKLTSRIPFYQARLLVVPGLTGWAQINMENDAAADDAEEKIQYDLYYIKNYSFFLDIRILLKTIAAVLSRSGR